ncbi:MAG: hypothetical protein RJQ21_09310 [Rhodospirillales bacterium]
MSVNNPAGFPGLDDLIRDLDRKGRILVEQVLEVDDGDPVRELWIARIGKPHHRLRTVDPALFGPVVVCPDILRGPLPNVWSHRDRLEANRAAIWKDTVSAGRYLDRAELGSKITGIVICLIFLSLVTTCVYKEATKPEPEDYRVVQ